ncbi:Protein FAM107A [Anabarilius grahami]|uniref:Actin-associated protein FAM107A n=1 Tax=Anabarilius grahami TaxID=495550 RepID=A0A3N0YPW9_ANAGA|nr:Protein FAM107A [Anabarilius grahami]
MDQRVGHSLYPPEGQPSRPRDVLVKSASAYADIQWEQPHQPRNPDRDPFGYPHREIPPLASYAPQPDYMTGDDDLIKPKKLINPVKASKSHQELHRELLMNQKRHVMVLDAPLWMALYSSATWGTAPPAVCTQQRAPPFTRSACSSPTWRADRHT